MFGFSFAIELFQGSAVQTWYCVTQFTNLLWHKLNHIRRPIMPRSRRRHHSRSRSRSHSHERDRDAKRRKIDSLDSPILKRSVSSEPEINAEKHEQERRQPTSVKNELPIQGHENKELQSKNLDKDEPILNDDDDEDSKEVKVMAENKSDSITELKSDEPKDLKSENVGTATKSSDDVVEVEDESTDSSNEESDVNLQDTSLVSSSDDKNLTKEIRQSEEKLQITPQKSLTPKQLNKKLESEKKRMQRQVEREERDKKKQEEKERIRQEKQKLKQEKEEQKQKERELKEEQKRKEREEKEAKRKEKEEREEQKRKEREREKLKKQQELDERNKEKQKQEEQKQKAAAAFVNFFVSKKPEVAEEKKLDDSKSSIFMPFEVKSDMKLPPSRRPNLTENEREAVDKYLESPDENASYLKDLKNGKLVGRCSNTWPYEDSSDDVMIVEDFGESICEEKKLKKMRAKFIKFCENRRPPYFGTWKKKSSVITARRPLTEDKKFFDYEVDSDDDWEEEEQGEVLNSSDDEDKDNETENDDYEVDNEFFVPHGHLSDDEVDDESLAKLSPESLKQKLKLLKDEFDQDMQTKTSKIKPRSIGCIWYKADGNNIDEAIDRHLRPLAMISNGPIIIKKRNLAVTETPNKKLIKELREDLVPNFLKLIHGNVNNQKILAENFAASIQKEFNLDISKTYIVKRLKEFADWKKCLEEGSMLNKFCWCVKDDVKRKYNIELPFN